MASEYSRNLDSLFQQRIQICKREEEIEEYYITIQETKVKIRKLETELVRMEAMNNTYNHCFLPPAEKMRLLKSVELDMKKLDCEREALKARLECEEFHLIDLKNKVEQLKKQLGS